MKQSRKHINNPKRYGEFSHGKLPGFDLVSRTYDPTEYYLTDDDYKQADLFKLAAKGLGLLDALIRASTIRHWGRPGGHKPHTDDILGRRNEIRSYRFKKDGDMYKVCKSAMKFRAKKMLTSLQQQTDHFQKIGRYLP